MREVWLAAYLGKASNTWKPFALFFDLDLAQDCIERYDHHDWILWKGTI